MPRTRTPEQRTSPLGRCQRRLRPLANAPGLVLRDGRQDVDGEAIRVRIVAADKVHAGFHERRGKRHVTGQSVEFRNQERCPTAFCVAQCLVEFRPVFALTGFDFDVLTDKYPVTLPDEITNSSLLSIETQSRPPLSLSADPVVPDELLAL